MKEFLLVALICISPIATIRAEKSITLKVLKTPSYFVLAETNIPLKLSLVDDLLKVVSGFSIDQKLNWDGIKTLDSKSFPSTILLFLTEEEILEVPIDKTYVINDDTYGQFNLMIKNATLSVKHLDHFPSKDEFKTFKQECSQSVSHSMIYTIQTGKSKDASNRINKTIIQFNQECATTQDSLAAFLLTQPKQYRNKRDVSTNEGTIVNSAEFYRDQYPALFNIIFWLSLILTIVIYAIAYNMWYMDPGLDTVIYRMTSQRIKKDQ